MEVAKIVFLTLFILARTENVENQRKGKICKLYILNFLRYQNESHFIAVNLFSVVRFPNNVCSGGSLNGTCYSAEECTSRGGVNGGSCAGGYGVCCTCKFGLYIFNCIDFAAIIIAVQLSCGQMSSENCTYFQSSGSEVGQCRIKICPCSDNICQLRLDFQNFIINQPKTSKYFWLIFNHHNDNHDGIISASESVQKINEKLFYDKGQCQTDVFTVTAPGNNAPPGICGTNSGEHSKKLHKE